MPLSRRRFLTGAGSLTAGLAGAVAALRARTSAAQPLHRERRAHHTLAAHDMRVVGECSSGTLDPDLYLTDFNWGDRTTDLGGGRTLREYDFVAVDKEIEIAPGVYFPAWTYNGRVPGPTIRTREGDRIRINFLNQGSHPHTIHFHGVHTAEMDGSMPEHYVHPGDSFLYEFDAEPFGL
ncbi:MAG: copper oxidase, partial [Planctomycetota bacterium]